MVTVSHLVEKILNEQPFLFQAIEEDIVSFGNLAARLEPVITKELGKEVKRTAVIMALRRYSEKIQKNSKLIKFDFSSEINLKTNLCDISILKSPSIMQELEKLYEIIDYKKGDTLNIIHGNYETSIITNSKYLNDVKKLTKGEKMIHLEKNLVALSLKFSDKFLFTPGVIATIVRKLTWENINIYELISTFTELTFIISQKDATKGYNSLQNLVDN